MVIFISLVLRPMKPRAPEPNEASDFLAKMKAYPTYQDECITFWRQQFGVDHSVVLEKLRSK